MAAAATVPVCTQNMSCQIIASGRSPRDPAHLGDLEVTPFCLVSHPLLFTIADNKLTVRG